MYKNQELILWKNAFSSIDISIKNIYNPFMDKIDVGVVSTAKTFLKRR